MSVEQILKCHKEPCVAELETEDVDSLLKTLEKHNVKPYIVAYEEAYDSDNAFLTTLVSLLDVHMAKCAAEYAKAMGTSVHIVKSKGRQYLLLVG